MAKKTYRTFSLKGLQIRLKGKDGNRVEIVFRSGIQVDSTAKFTTTSEELQELLEQSSGFGRDYYVESVVDDKKEAAPVKEEKAAPAPEPKKEIMSEMKDTRRFQNLVEMKNAMAEVGIAVTPEMNYSAAKSAAQKAGYDFQIKK